MAITMSIPLLLTVLVVWLTVLGLAIATITAARVNNRSKKSKGLSLASQFFEVLNP
jgi:hypothetical protein